MRRAVLLGLLVGCGEVKGESIDAPPVVNVDAPPDAETPNDTFRYVADTQRVPTNNAEAREVALDLNGDGTVDNQLGLVFGTLASQGFDVAGATKSAIDRGQILMLIDFATASFADDATATYTMMRGINPNPPPCADPNDLMCRRHLDGSATFGVDTSLPKETPLAGAVAGGIVTAGPGRLNVEVMLGPGNPIPLTLRGARVQLKTVSDTRIGEGIVAGAVPRAEIDTTVIPVVTANFTGIVNRDCNPLIPPMCNCDPGSTGNTLLSLFDTNPRDCKIDVAEVQNNSLIQSLLAPDVMVDGVASLSFGFGISAVRAAFTPP